MEIKNLNDLRALVELLRELGVAELEVSGTKLRLGPGVLQQPSRQPGPEAEDPEFKAFKGLNPNYSHPSLGLLGKLPRSKDS